MSWKEVCVGDVISTKKGFAFKSTKYVSKGVPIVRVSDFTTDSISDGDLKFYPQEEKEQYKEFELKEKDIIVQTVGSWQNNPASVVGKVVHVPYFIDGALLNQNAVKIIPNGEIDRDYFFYRLRTDEFKGHVLGEARGAANQASITLETIKSFRFLLPGYNTQVKIGRILSAYDNLVENNQKQIKLLEEVAQRFYKEWFVDLRFPGYEDCKFEDGVPEGWENKQIKDLGEIITGKTPSTTKSAYYGGNIQFVKIPDMHSVVYPLTTEITLTEEGANTQKNKFIPKNSIMVSCIATVGLVNISVEECQTNQQINSIVLKEKKMLYYVYSAMKQMDKLLDCLGSNGATMTNVNKKKFENIELLIPTVELIYKYNELCNPIFRKILSLSKSSIKAKKMRDILLPKLMEGELEV